MIGNGDAAQPARSVRQAMWRGFRERCPKCGTGAMYHKFLKVADQCPHCGEELHHQRADDAPPYFTITIVGHVVVGGVLMVERAFQPSLWAHAAMWLPLTVVSSLLLLPRIKGAIVGLQWALRMHGFGGTADHWDPPPAPRAASE